MDKQAQIVALLRIIEDECEDRPRRLAQKILKLLGYQPKDREDE